jgi:hypothetical protein
MQMLNIRSHVYTHTIQNRLCQLSPCLYLLTRYILPMKYSIYILNLFYFLWILIHISELLIYRRDRIHNSIRYGLLNHLINLYDNLGIQTLLNYIQEHIHIVTLMKMFWLTKILILPLGIRTIYTNPFLNNITMKNELNIMNYNETLTKTIYFTVLFYGTETMFT